MQFYLLAALVACLPNLQVETLDVHGDAVTITRDGFGVPRITASTLEGLFHGAGYAAAQDRLWQMETNRRAARGELAEILGKDALEQDKSARTGGYTEDERLAQFARLPERFRIVLQSYAAGVNAWMTKAQAEGGPGLPKPFAEHGVVPLPWRVTDSVALAQMMSQRFGAFGEGELRNLMLYTYLKSKLKDRALLAVNDIAWFNDPQSPTTIPPEEDTGAHQLPKPPPIEVTRKHLEMLPELNVLDLLGGMSAMAIEPQMEFAAAHGLYTRFGSYAVAVSAERSATGHGLLLGAPQMGWSTPQIAYEMRLTGAGIDVVGMTFPGIPGVLIGHTEDMAWTTTSGLGDGADVFFEEIDPNDPGRYMYKGHSVPFNVRTEVIRVKGQEPVELEVRRSAHGPIIKTIRKWAFARRASYWNRELENLVGFYGFYSAKTLADFERACANIVTSHHFLAVTKDGHIGYWYTGLYPERSDRIDPRFPVPGNGDYEWQGFVPFDELPKCIDPERGWLANWNNKPAAWYPNSDTPVWGAIFRSQHINDFLSAREFIGPDDLKEMVREIATYQLDGEYFLPMLLSAAGTANLSGPAKRAVRLLSAWDRHERDGSAAAAIFRRFTHDLREEVFLETLGNFGNASNFQQITQASYLWHVLGGSPLKPALDYLDGRSRDEALIATLEKTVAALTKEHGDDLSAVPFRAGRMNLSPLPDVPYGNRGTYILIAEMARPRVRSVSVVCPGQSEDPTSPHYSDQRDIASWWGYKPLAPSAQR